jgi:phage terminase small subunit
VARGRRAQPDAVKALKGNPGKRKLALEGAAGKGASSPKLPAFAMPEFLVHEREKTIFRAVVEDYLQRRVARAPDLTAYARWATYVHRWVQCKEFLEGKATWFKIESKHGQRLARHPMFKDMIDLERMLQSLEDRLGLNPVARQNIIRGLSAMPAALGGLFGDEKAAEEDKQPSDIPDSSKVDEPLSPLGYLQAAGKQSLN